MSLDIPSISPQELMDRIGTPHAPMLFDVRRREVFDAADRLIGGANWRHHQETNAWIEEIPPSAEIVVYCVHGHQMSQSPVSRLRAKGVNARKLVGGIDAYVEAGGVTILKSEYLPKSYETPSRWITRECPKVDRLAWPWFIKRFVDPRAEILYADADWVMGSAVELDAIPFDIPDTDFSHDGEK